MIKLFASLVIITIIKMGSCELNTTLSGYVVNTVGGDIPVADIIEPGWGQEPRQNPNRFLNRPGKHRIIGGNKTDIELYPFVASVRFFGEHICGATYIHLEWVLTAVHCLRSGTFQEAVIPANDLLVKMGSADLFADNEQSREVEKAVTHETYNYKYYHNDIALLKLSEPFDLGPKTKIVVMQTAPRNYDNVVCSVVGWGYTSTEDSKSQKVSRYLLKIELAIINQSECVKLYAIPGTIKEDGIICAGTPTGIDVCHGDSGGPLICDNVQVGIVSANMGCKITVPSMYTRVSHYVSWIKTQIERYPVMQSGNISFKCSVYIILGVFIFKNIVWYY